MTCFHRIGSLMALGVCVASLACAGAKGNGGTGGSGGGSGGGGGAAGSGGGPSGGQLGSKCTTSADCLNHRACIDGYCCNSNCEGTCESCDVKGSEGKCGLVPAGSEDGGCQGNKVCDGAGLCKLKTGQVCTQSGECASQFCADDVCCDSKCMDACMACDLPETMGTCSPMPADAEDEVATVPCKAPDKCSAGGAAGDAGAPVGDAGAGSTMVCIRAQGGPCTSNAGCISGFCANGFCCNEACTEACKTCALKDKEGTCSPTAKDSEDKTCKGNNKCDGNGFCVKPYGSSCTAKTECAGGNLCCPTAPGSATKTCNQSYGCDCSADPTICGGENPFCCKHKDGSPPSCTSRAWDCLCASASDCDAESYQCCGTPMRCQGSYCY